MNSLAKFISEHMEMTVLVIALVLFIWMLFSRAARFWIMDRWMDIPLIGTLPRKARMTSPDASLANRRLDQVYRAYRNFIGNTISEEEFKNKRSFLRLAGDADAKPTPILWTLGIFFLLGAEALAFSFVLATVLSPDPTASQADAMTLVIAFLLAFLLAYLVGKAGHSFRRTHTLRQCIAKLRAGHDVVPEEKAEKELTSLIDPEDDQTRDEALTYDNSSQRLLNRVRKNSNDRGSYALPMFAAVLVVALAIGQVWLREYSFDQAAASAPAALAAAPTADTGEFQLEEEKTQPLEVAEAKPPAAAQASSVHTQQVAGNIVLVLIFVTTQALAFSIGYRFDFIGRGGAEVHHALRGAAIYNELVLSQSAVVHMADESLKSLVERFNANYPDMKVQDLSYEARCALDLDPAGETAPPSKANGASKASRPAAGPAPDGVLA